MATLQRGEPAIVDKWQRARAALENGVDLIVELPPAWSVQSADFFAKGAIRILQSLDCSFYVLERTLPNHLIMKHLRILSETIKKSSTSFSKRMLREPNLYTKMHAAFAAVYPDFWQRLICLITYWACAMLVKRVSIHHQ